MVDSGAAAGSTGNPLNASGDAQFPPARLLVRFVLAGLALTVLAFRIWTPLMLTCLALGGFAGMFLWPVLRRVWVRRELDDLSPVSEGSLRLSRGDLESAPTIDPALGLCTTLTWFVGMMIITPLYHPYARLFFPLLASIWLGAAGGVSWWLESNISVARRAVSPVVVRPRGSWGQQLVSSMLATAVVASFLKFDGNNGIALVTRQDLSGSSLGIDRTSIVDAATTISDFAVRSARDEIAPSSDSDPADSLPAEGRTFSPDEVVLSTLAEPLSAPPQLTSDDRRRTRLVVYVYGEPALLLHLNQAGIVALPVSHLSLRGPENASPPTPAFIVIGPHAKRTPGFWEQWMRRMQDFESVADIEYRPGQVTLLDLFTPQWLAQHPESQIQTLELYRVR